MKYHSSSFHLQTPIRNNKTKTATSLNADIHTTKNKYQNAHTSYKSFLYGDEGSLKEVTDFYRHLTALKDLEELKEHYYEQYLENLESKVLGQRKKIAKENEKSCHVKHSKKTNKKISRLPRHELRHDSQYMQQVTKSRYYHILATKDVMHRKGLIKTKQDEEEFWKKASTDKRLWSEPLPRNVPLELITDMMSSRFRTSRHHSKHQNIGSKRVAFSTTPAKSFPNLDTSQLTNGMDDKRIQSQKLSKFKVKMKPPNLHSFSTTLLPPIYSEPPAPVYSNRRDKILESLGAKQRAFNIAMVNHAMSKKMMRLHEMYKEDPEFVLHETAALCNNSQDGNIKILQEDEVAKSVGSREKQVFITEPVYGIDQVLIPDLEYKYASSKPRTQENKKERPNGTQDKVENDLYSQTEMGVTTANLTELEKDDKKGSLPLNLSMMLDNQSFPVREAKCPSTFWVNYTRNK